MKASTRPVFSFRFSPLSKRPIIRVSANRKRGFCDKLWSHGVNKVFSPGDRVVSTEDFYCAKRHWASFRATSGGYFH